MTPSLDIQLRIGPEDKFQDELAIFGGQTRVVTNKFLSRRKHKFPSRPRAERERAESEVLERYLPAQLDDAELATLVDAAVAEAGATSPRDMGAVMKIVQPRVAGRADGRRVSDAVRSRLG